MEVLYEVLKVRQAAIECEWIYGLQIARFLILKIG